jgi:hypothetical protein
MLSFFTVSNCYHFYVIIFPCTYFCYHLCYHLLLSWHLHHENDIMLYNQKDNTKELQNDNIYSMKSNNIPYTQRYHFRVLSFMLSFDVIIYLMLSFNVIIFDVISFGVIIWCYQLFYAIIWCYLMLSFLTVCKCYHFCAIIFPCTGGVLSFMLSFNVIIFVFIFPLFFFFLKTWHTPRPDVPS